MTRVGLWGSIFVLVLVGIGGFVSFFWLPRAQLDTYPTWFGAFCAALGVPEPRRVGLIVPLTSHSDVVLTHHLLEAPQPADIGVEHDAGAGHPVGSGVHSGHVDRVE